MRQSVGFAQAFGNGGRVRLYIEAKSDDILDKFKAGAIRVFGLDAK